MKQDFSEELYGLLGEVINRRESAEITNSLRGEYGVLRYLLFVEDDVGAGELRRSLNVVPGRMADILKSLERKGLIQRSRDPSDGRAVRVRITEAGRAAAARKRDDIRNEYRRLYELLGERDTKELIRLLKVLLEFYRMSDEEKK